MSLDNCEKQQAEVSSEGSEAKYGQVCRLTASCIACWVLLDCCAQIMENSLSWRREKNQTTLPS
jgi:hypothetical protein